MEAVGDFLEAAALNPNHTGFGRGTTFWERITVFSP